MAKKKRSAAQIRATKKKSGKRGPGRPRGSRLARKIAKVGGLGFHGKAHINRSRIAHADAVDKRHGLKPTSFLVEMLAKAPKHIVELQNTVAKRLASDARPGAKRAKHAKKAKSKSGSAPKRKSGRKGSSAAQKRNDKRLGQMARARGKGRSAKKPRKSGRKRGPGRPKGSKNKKRGAGKSAKKRGPGRPKGSKNRAMSFAELEMASWAGPRKRSPKQLRNDARLRAKGDRTRLKNQKKWGKKRHKTAHKKSNWQAITPGFAGVNVFGT